ncbi:MAG: hypothetical protein ABEI11_00530 [Haloarculaceae archaeon]
MATVPERTRETGAGGVHRRRLRRRDRRDRLSPWLLVAAYGATCAVLLAGAAGVAVALGTALPGRLGVAAFFTVGVGLVAAAPAVARALFERGLDARDARRLRRARRDR